MTLVTFDHCGFTVADLDRSIAFYSELLGAEPTVRKRSSDSYMGAMVGYPGCDMEYAYFPLPGSNATLELIQYFEPASARVDQETSVLGNGHICLLVEDVHAEFERISRIATFRSAAPVEIDAGPNAGGWGAYLRDPDGITIQLLQKPARSR
jgi:catechol 2,3-dioxygenase-like lactoylglutathione lyase family enzyme